MSAWPRVPPRPYTPASTHASPGETSWAHKFELLGASCARAYVDYIHFESPVLDPHPLHRAWDNGQAPFPPDSLLHHALVAAATPWLDERTVSLQRLGDREDMFRMHIRRFKVHRYPVDLASAQTYIALADLDQELLAKSPAQTPLDQAQSLLLSIFAVSRMGTQAARDDISQWLRLVTSNLQQAHPQPRGLPQSSLRRRLWWTAFVTEQLHHLRCSFEERQTAVSPRCQLDPSSAEPLLAEDLDLDTPGPSGGRYLEYWTRMRQAQDFVQLKALFQQVAQVTAGRSQSEMPPPPPGAPQGSEEHARVVRRLAETLSIFHQERSRNFVSGISDDAEADHGTALSRISLHITYARVIITLCQAPPRTTKQTQGSASSSKKLLGIMLQTIERLASIATNTLQQVTVGQLPPASVLLLLRPIIVTTRALLVLTQLERAIPTHIGHLKGQLRSLLDECLAASEALWSGGRPPLSASTATPDMTPATTWTPTSCSRALTPAENSSETISDDKIAEQQDLLGSFDDMWNKHIVTGVRVHHNMGHI